MAIFSAVVVVACALASSVTECSRQGHAVFKTVLTEHQAELWAARALDGTPYAFYSSAYSRESNAETPRDWIVYLEGGGECETHADCVERAGTTQGSSTNLPDTLDPDKDVSDGMTSKDPKSNPDFYKFGTLFLPYLSGDDWIGQQRVACVPWGAGQNCSGVGSGDLRPLFFSGHNNVEAAISIWFEDLAVKPRSLLLSGGSAGGQGAYFHADRLAELLPGVIVKANPQYGWFGAPTDTFPDWQKGQHTDSSIPYPSSGSPIAVPAWMYNISLYLPKNCVAMLKAHESPLLCTALPRVALTVNVPLFVSTNLFDGWLTSEMEQVPDGKLGPTATDPKLEYMLRVTAPSQRSTVKKATSSKPWSANGAFVPACFEHPMEWTQASQSYNAPVLGAHNCTHGAAVAAWFFERNNCERYLIDSETRPDVLASMGCNNGVFRTYHIQSMRSARKHGRSWVRANKLLMPPSSSVFHYMYV